MVGSPFPRLERREPCISSPASTRRTLSAPTAERTPFTMVATRAIPGLLLVDGLARTSSSWPWKSLVWRIVNVTGTDGACLLYTSDAADDLLCVDLGGR